VGVDGGLIQPLVDVVVLVWSCADVAEIEEGVGEGVGGAPQVFQPLLVRAGLREVCA